MKYIVALVLLLTLTLTGRAQQSNPAIQVEVTGEGSPLLLIPGFTVPGESWNTVVEALQNDYQCHVVTIAGFGGKKPIEFPWLPEVSKALHDYIATAELEDVTVMGHSLGGTLATWLASREDSKVGRIILVDALPATGALMFPNYHPDNFVYESPYNKQQLGMNAEQFEQMATMMAKGMSLNEQAQQQIKSWIIQADRETYVYGYTDYLKMDLREDLKNINIPVTILAADKPYGKEAALNTYKQQYANLTDYELIMAENSGHFIMFDQPDWFLEQVQKILSSN